LNPLGNVTINEKCGLQIVQPRRHHFGPGNEIQFLSVTAIFQAIRVSIPNRPSTYTDPNTTENLTFNPMANAFGNLSTVTDTVNDGQRTNNTITRSLFVTFNAVNQPPR